MRFRRIPFWSMLLVLLPLAAAAATPVAQVMDNGAEDGDTHVVASDRLPPQELSAKVLYQLLLAEIAGQRDRPTLAVSTYLELARTTHDPRISQRATEVALFARNGKAALEASRLWVTQDPDSDRARQTLSGLLVSEGKLSEAKPYLEQMLAKAGPQTGALFMTLHSLLSRHQDKAAVQELVDALAKPYPAMPEAHYAKALAALDAGHTDAALASIRTANGQRPGWEAGALLQGQILSQGKSDQPARAYFTEFLQKYPAAQDVRLFFARMLVDGKDFPGARQQFEAILKAAPDNADYTMAVGLLSIQLQDFDAAEKYLQTVLKLGGREPDTVRFYLGQIREERQDWAGAAQWYGAVESGDQFVPARMRIAAMLARQNRLQEGRDLLHSLPAETPEQRVLLVQADGQLLGEAKKYKEAWDVLAEGLKKVPDSADLLYDRAMMAEKMDRLDLLETDLREVIKLKPEHAHAYNALGFTLADRTTRYQEALVLIRKAVELAPGDPFIIDSLGWVQFRLGQFDEAAVTLKDAFGRQPDPEIAAHLGQVLWAQGNKDEARKIWNTNLQQHPDSDALRAVVAAHPL